MQGGWGERDGGRKVERTLAFNSILDEVLKLKDQRKEYQELPLSVKDISSWKQKRGKNHGILYLAVKQGKET